MATKEALKKKVCEAIDRRQEKIESIGDTIMRNPELGFKEHRTARVVSDLMAEFQIPHQTGLAITGVKGTLQAKIPGPTLALIGELDSLMVPDHPMADPETGAAHACGHNGQIAGLMGAMMGLVDAGAVDFLAGNIVFFAVPAEEYIEVEYRVSQVKAGKLGLLGGKPELIRLGHFDDVDMAMMIHGHSRPDLKKVIMGKSSNGCVVKLVRFLGKAAHAGSSPHEGINALNAAHIALAAIHAQRETFRDHDTIRVHPIITRGGDTVNVVPSEVTLETFVRGRTIEAFTDANSKIDRALRAGAMAMGAKVEIQTIPGYMPLTNDPEMIQIFQQNAEILFGGDEYMEGGHGTGSTDMGDISLLMPAIHPGLGGAIGTSHGMDYEITDKQLTYCGTAKLLAMTAIDMLHGDAEEGKRIIKDFEPVMTIEQYITHQQQAFRTEMFDGATGTSETTEAG
ncbi:MAG: amidohydrolase [Desulfobacterales bacterium]